MKKEYIEPTIEVSSIILEDIIAVSTMDAGEGVFKVFDNLFNTQ